MPERPRDRAEKTVVVAFRIPISYHDKVFKNLSKKTKTDIARRALYDYVDRNDVLDS